MHYDIMVGNGLTVQLHLIHYNVVEYLYLLHLSITMHVVHKKYLSDIF